MLGIESKKFDEYIEAMEEGSPNYDFVITMWYQLTEEIPMPIIWDFMTAIDTSIEPSIQRSIDRQMEQSAAMKRITKKDLLRIEPWLSFIAGMAYADKNWKEYLENK
nr:MAG TPA: hypothetical protein [Caudoviricetes sp.]